MYGWCWEGVRKIGVWRILGRSVEGIWKVFGGGLKCVLKVSERCLGIIKIFLSLRGILEFSDVSVSITYHLLLSESTLILQIYPQLGVNEVGVVKTSTPNLF